MPKRKRKPPKESVPKPSPPLGALDDYIDRKHGWEKAFSPSPPHPAKPLLPCGCYSHPNDREEEWSSPKFAEDEARRKEQLEVIIKAIRRKSPPRPDEYPPFPDTSENKRIYAVKQYFQVLRLRSRSRSEYLAQVDRYEEANRNFLKRFLCRREGKVVPLHPSEIEGLLRPGALLTHRAGGPRTPPLEQERDALIWELKQQWFKDPAICERLDLEEKVLPDEWRQKQISSWAEAYFRIKKNVQSFLSKRGTKPKSRS